MARQIITKLIDDVDGSEAAQTVDFGLDGVTYSIDLSDPNAAALRDVLAPYLAAGQRQSGRGRASSQQAPTAPRRSREQIAAIRVWAKANGYEVSDRGRIPADVEEAFEKAHK